LGVGSCKGCEVAAEPSNSKLWVSEMIKNFVVMVDCNAIMTNRINVFNVNRRVVNLYGCVSSLTEAARAGNGPEGPVVNSTMTWLEKVVCTLVR